MSATVPSSDTVTLSFTLVAPDEAGSYSEPFNRVQEGVAWFSDTPPGGGPADDTIALDITVTEGAGGSGGGGGHGGDGSAGDETPQGIPNSGLSGSCSMRPDGPVHSALGSIHGPLGERWRGGSANGGAGRRMRASTAWALALAVATIGCNATQIAVAEHARLNAAAATAPPLESRDHRGQPFSLDQALERGPVALIFYRGFW